MTEALILTDLDRSLAAPAAGSDARRLSAAPAWPGWGFRTRRVIFPVRSVSVCKKYLTQCLLLFTLATVSYEEKGTWVYLATSAGAYAVYLAIILGRVLSGPVAHVPYVPVLLWTTGASIVASIA